MNKQPEENLKPCPFCGGWSDFGITEDGDNCVVCNCCFVSSESFKTEQEAREAWNKREGESIDKQTEETREERIKRQVANSARARLLEVCVPVFELARGGSYYYHTGFATIKMSAIVAQATMDMEIQGEDMDGAYTEGVERIMLEGGHVLYTNEAGSHDIYLLSVHGEHTSMDKQPDVVKFDGVMYAREPQFSLRVNGNSSMLCQTEEDCGYENAIIEFSDVLVELVKVYASYDGENFSYQHPIKIVSKSNIREDGS